MAFDYLFHGAAGAMTCVHFGKYEDRVFLVYFLEQCSHFAGVERINACVFYCCGEKSRGVLRSWLDVVIRAPLQDIFEILCFFWISIFMYPAERHAKEWEPHHVGQRYL